MSWVRWRVCSCLLVLLEQLASRVLSFPSAKLLELLIHMPVSILQLFILINDCRWLCGVELLSFLVFDVVSFDLRLQRRFLCPAYLSRTIVPPNTLSRSVLLPTRWCYSKYLFADWLTVFVLELNTIWQALWLSIQSRTVLGIHISICWVN